MKAIPAVLSLCATLTLFKVAHSEGSSQPTLRVPYNPEVPSQIRQSTHASKPTRFYGNVVIYGQKWALHFYDLQPLRKINMDQATQKSQLDLFVQKRRGKHTVFERLQRIPITYERWPYGKLKVQVDVMWLDPASRTIPMLKMRLENQISSGGMTGSDVLFIFRKGLNGVATNQKFPFYYYEGPTGASSNKFDQVDKHGFLSVFEEYKGNEGINYAVWKWNGKKFIKTTELHIPHDSPKRYQSNGEGLVEK